MKIKLFIYLFLCFVFNFNSRSCSGPNNEALNLSPGQSVQVVWDFTDCNFGINAFRIELVQISKNGTRKELPPNTPLQADAINITTGEAAYHVGDPFILQFPSNVCGSTIVLTLTYSSNSKHNLQFQMVTAENIGGPCQ